MVTQELTKVGEMVVSKWLKSHGYFWVGIDDTTLPIVEADGGMRRITVLVNAYESAKSPASALPKNKIRQIRTIASERNREAWAAIVEIGERNSMIGSIKWIDLSKNEF